MATKNRKYTDILKEAFSEFDTTKSIDTTGPMTKQILSYKGDGELKTNTDVTSVLERFYNDDYNDYNNVEVLGEHEDNEIDDIPSDNISSIKKDIEDEITEADDLEGGDEGGDESGDEGVEEGYNESDELSESEEAVIEKLIAEMEDEEEEEGGEEEGGGEEEEGELDVDTEIEEKEPKSESVLGPLGNPNDIDEEYEDIQESFEIFKEEIEDDDLDSDSGDLDSDDIQI